MLVWNPEVIYAAIGGGRHIVTNEVINVTSCTVVCSLCSFIVSCSISRFRNWVQLTEEGNTTM